MGEFNKCSSGDPTSNRKYEAWSTNKRFCERFFDPAHTSPYATSHCPRRPNLRPNVDVRTKGWEGVVLSWLGGREGPVRHQPANIPLAWPAGAGELQLVELEEQEELEEHGSRSCRIKRWRSRG